MLSTSRIPTCSRRAARCCVFWQRDDRWTPLPTRVGSRRASAPSRHRPPAADARGAPGRPHERRRGPGQAPRRRCARPVVPEREPAPPRLPHRGRAGSRRPRERAGRPTSKQRRDARQPAADDAQDERPASPRGTAAIPPPTSPFASAPVACAPSRCAGSTRTARSSSRSRGRRCWAHGSGIEIAWSERRDWFTADVRVAPPAPTATPTRACSASCPPPPRSSTRAARLAALPIKVGVRGRVEKGADTQGDDRRLESLDLSEGGVAFPCELPRARQGRRRGGTPARPDRPARRRGHAADPPRHADPPASRATAWRAPSEKPSKSFERAIKQHILTYCSARAVARAGSRRGARSGMNSRVQALSL